MPWLLALLVLEGGLLAEGKTMGFDQGDLGKLPAGWQAAQTGQGEGSVWKVVALPRPGRSACGPRPTPRPISTSCW